MKKILIKTTALCALCVATMSTTWAQQNLTGQNGWPLTSYPGERYPMINPAMPAYDKAVWFDGSGVRQDMRGYVGNPGERYSDNSGNVPREDRASNSPPMSNYSYRHNRY